MKMVFSLMAVLLLTMNVSVQAQGEGGWDSEPEPDFCEPDCGGPPPPQPLITVILSGDIDDAILSEGILCPGCETEDDFRLAARVGCFTGYREGNDVLANILVTGDWGRVPETGEIAGDDDPCVYNMEVRGNLRTDAKVTVTVCNGSICLLVTHQFVPDCPGVGARIGANGVAVSIDGCLLFATGIEGLCTTVRRADLTEDQQCITTVTDQGMLPPPLPDIPGLDTINFTSSTPSTSGSGSFSVGGRHSGGQSIWTCFGPLFQVF